MDSGRAHDIERLNALLDGELSATERADIAARLATDRDLASAYATLARLKAATAEAVGDCPAIVLRRPWWPRVRRRVAAVAAGIALAIGGAILITQAWPPTSDAPPPGAAEGPTEIALASLPAGTTVPSLDSAGLKLVHLAFTQNSVPLFTATYRGPHGCRLDLMAWPVTENAPPARGSGSHRWVIGTLTYELTAHGMPDWRFRVIADGAEQQTRLASNPGHIDRRLREASRGAPPCLG